MTNIPIVLTFVAVKGDDRSRNETYNNRKLYGQLGSTYLVELCIMENGHCIKLEAVNVFCVNSPILATQTKRKSITKKM